MDAMIDKSAEPSVIHANPTDSHDAREFLDGSRRFIATLRSVRIGIGTYEPEWKWSLHAGPQTGKPSARHIGYILSGRMAVRDSGGNEVTLGPGQAFEVGPDHDAWVVGSEPCIALDFGVLA